MAHLIMETTSTVLSREKANTTGRMELATVVIGTATPLKVKVRTLGQMEEFTWETGKAAT